MNEVRHVIHLALHRNFRRRLRLVKVGAQKLPELDDVEDDKRIHGK
jgi:hypothetical protein